MPTKAIEDKYKVLGAIEVLEKYALENNLETLYYRTQKIKESLKEN